MKFSIRFAQAYQSPRCPWWVFRAVVILLVLGWQGPAFSQQSVRPPAEAPVFPDYRLGPEDMLAISVWQEKDLKENKVLVRPDGKLSFPLAGEIDAAGMTPGQLQVEITKRLRKYIPDPVVTVLVEKVAGYRVYVIGQVRNPGVFVLGQYVDVMQALALAGGLTPFAAENKIKILRRDNQGIQRSIPFEYSSVANGEDLKQNILLKSGDMIVVP